MGACSLVVVCLLIVAMGFDDLFLRFRGLRNELLRACAPIVDDNRLVLIAFIEVAPGPAIFGIIGEAQHLCF